MQDQFVNIGSVRTRYRSAGERGSAVILLHGIARSLEDWSENMHALSRFHRVFAVDLVGCGLSDKPNVAYSIPMLAGFVQDFMRALKLEQATLVGNSMGGAVSLELAFTNPSLVHGLVLVAPAGMGPKGADFLGLCSVPILGEVISKPSLAGSKRLLQGLYADKRFWTDARAERDFELARQPGATRAFLRMLRFMANRQGAKPSFYGPMLERLPNLRQTTLVVWGEQDHILPIEYAAVAASKIPGAQVQRYDPCGHFPMVERATEFNALVLEFLELVRHRAVTRSG